MTAFEVTVSKGWMARTLGVSFDREYYLDPERRREIDSRCEAYVRTELGDLDACFTESNLGRRAFIDDRQVLVGGIQPNLIQGMLLGAELLAHEAIDADISLTCAAGRDPAELPSPDEQLRHEWIQLFDRQLDEVRERGEWMPVPPFFWDRSGRAAVHGALTTAQKFFGEELLIDLIANPDRARRAMEWVAESNVTLVGHFAQRCGIEVTTVHVGECSACTIGATSFEELVAPTITRMGEALGPIRLHSCGPSDHLLEAFRSIPAVASLDLGGETSMARVRGIFGRELPVSFAPLVPDLTAESPGALLAWARRLLEENDGGELAVLLHLEDGYRLESVRALRELVCGGVGE